MNPPDRVLDTLIALECSLHQPAVRRDRTRLEALLHQEFQEFGRSGRAWSRAEVFELLAGPEAASPPEVVAQGFAGQRLADGVVLLTYHSAHRRADGRLVEQAWRSSIWLRTPAGWRLRLHQGTPTGPFAQPAG